MLIYKNFSFLFVLLSFFILSGCFKEKYETTALQPLTNGALNTTNSTTSQPAVVNPPVVTPTPTQPVVTTTWVKCANEFQTCTFTGTRRVLYSPSLTDSRQSIKTFTNLTPCTNAVFSDVSPNVPKFCYYENTETSVVTQPPVVVNPPVVTQPPVAGVTTPEARFSEAKAVLTKNCAGCHGQGSTVGNLILTNESDYISAKLVTPKNLALSKIVTRLQNYPVNIAGRTMPPGQPISASDYSKLVLWVENIAVTATTSPTGTKDLFTCDPNELPQPQSIAKLNKIELYNTLNGLISRPFGQTEANQILRSELANYVSGVPNDIRQPFTRADKSLNSSHIKSYFDLADELAQNITANASRYQRLVSTYVNYSPNGCTALDVNNLSVACRDAFAKNFAMRAWGRPVETTDVNLNNEFTSLLKTFRSGVSSNVNVNNFIFRVLISPSFINHTFLDLKSTSGQIGQLSSFAVARKLSFHFMRTQLDEEMIKIATQNDLTTDVGINIALNYILPRSQPMISEFVDEWLKLYNMPNLNSTQTSKYAAITKDLQVDNNLKEAMKQEIIDLMIYLDQSNRPVTEVLTSDISFARNSSLMKIYGLTTAAPTTVTEANAVRFSKEQGRTGVPSRAAMLFSGSDTESPIKRGHHIRQMFLCSETKGVPPASAATTPLLVGEYTYREKITAATASASCIGCHSQINPPGFAYSQFNALGAFQDFEPVYNGNTFIKMLRTDPVVDLIPIFGLMQSSKNAADFNNIISQSDDFKKCFTQYYYTFAVRAKEKTTSLNSCEMRNLQRVISNGGTLRDFFKSVVLGVQFKQRLIIK